LHLVWDAAPGWTVLNVVMAVLQGVLPLLAVLLMGLIRCYRETAAQPGAGSAVRHFCVLRVTRSV
jgi:hypothetical protein